MYSLIALACAMALVAISVYIFNGRKYNFDRYLKILVITFCVIGTFRYVLSDAFVEVAFDFSDPVQSFLRWGYYISYAVIPMAVFTESRLFRNIASYFTLPMALLSVIFIEDTMAYFFMPEAGGFQLASWFRYTYYIAELVLAVSIPVLMQLYRGHKFEINNKTEWFNFALGLPAVLLVMMPSYMLQSLFGLTDISDASFSPLHIGWMLFIPLECVVIYLYFKGRSKEDRYNLLLFLSLAQLFHTNSIFLRGFTLSRMPLQLCSIAAFFYLATVITKNKKLFDFCYLSNIVGALIAIFLASFTSGAFSFWTIHYMQEHTFVMLMPILAIALHVFPRVNRESIKNAIFIFSIYFLFCFISGTIINGISGEPGTYTVNYFYMFNLDTALDYVPFAGFTGAIHWQLGSFGMYPILVLVVYAAFVALFVGFYFLTELIYKIIDKLSARKFKMTDTTASA